MKRRYIRFTLVHRLCAQPFLLMIRIANGQGFWGDWLEAPVRLVDGGPIDYLTLDYLAEVTMSILQKQRQADPELGYARDFPPLIGRIAKKLRERHIKVVANAGGVNPICLRARRVESRARIESRRGAGRRCARPHRRVPRQRLRDAQHRHRRAALDDSRTHPQRQRLHRRIPAAEALATGADVVISGRCADAALVLAPMIDRFGWGPQDYDKLAAGIVAGHIIECGAQCCGGNCQVDWQNIPDLANIGYPIVEAEPDGSFAVTKHPGTGGRIDSHGVKEQLLYEIGDPRQYMTPDCVADFTSLQLETPARTACEAPACAAGRGRHAEGFHQLSRGLEGVRHAGLQLAQRDRKGARGRPHHAPAPRSTGAALRRNPHGILRRECLPRPAARPVDDPPEVQVRIGVRGPDKRAVDRFTREMIPLVLTGPPGGTGYGEGRPEVRQIVAYWPALIPRDEIHTRVEVVA
jgi:hypothetical protein